MRLLLLVLQNQLPAPFQLAHGLLVPVLLSPLLLLQPELHPLLALLPIRLVLLEHLLNLFVLPSQLLLIFLFVFLESSDSRGMAVLLRLLKLAAGIAHRVIPSAGPVLDRAQLLQMPVPARLHPPLYLGNAFRNHLHKQLLLIPLILPRLGLLIVFLLHSPLQRLLPPHPLLLESLLSFLPIILHSDRVPFVLCDG